MFDISTFDMAASPLAYCYDAGGVYTHAEACALDVLESEIKGGAVWLLPGSATRVAPPEHWDGHARFWDGKAWVQVEDHRGEGGYVNGEPHTITEIGPYPEGWSATPPPVPLSEALENARAVIFTRRRQAEYGGFMFDGERWDSEEKDELRLNSMITMMDKTGIVEFPGWKINAGAFITLTPELAVQAAAGLMGHYAACFQAEAVKKAALKAAGCVNADDVQAWLDANVDVGWPDDGQE